jgi:hypothetical protein
MVLVSRTTYSAAIRQNCTVKKNTSRAEHFKPYLTFLTPNGVEANAAANAASIKIKEILIWIMVDCELERNV